MDYRTTPGACLSCSTPLEPFGRRRVCPECRSCQVPMPEVQQAMLAMWPSGTPPPPVATLTPLVNGFGTPRPCPQCTAVMAPCLLLAIAIDRCAAHGLWFDHDELERVLLSSGPKAPTDDIGTLGIIGGTLDGLGTLLELLGIFVT